MWLNKLFLYVYMFMIWSKPKLWWVTSWNHESSNNPPNQHQVNILTVIVIFVLLLFPYHVLWEVTTCSFLLFRTEILHQPAVSQRSLKQASPCFPVTSHAALAQQRFAATVFFFPQLLLHCVRCCLFHPALNLRPHEWVSCRTTWHSRHSLTRGCRSAFIPDGS